MSDQPTDDLDVGLDREDFRAYQGNRVTREYVQRALADILDDHTPVAPSDVHPGRPSLAAG
ncbi:MAG: hypothetical protein ACRDRI_10270 [Pseudonocardiaceae bacterium]